MREAGITARYNVIKKKVEIALPEHAGSPENFDNVTLTHIVSLCAQHGMPIGSVPEYVNAIADRSQYNPVADWIRSRPWDGQDRLPDVYATITHHPDYIEPLKHVLMRKWLRSAAAAALVPGFKSRGVLTLQGPQGIGKTSWIKALVSDGPLRDSVVKVDHHLDGHNKDSVINAVSHWIVEIGELDSSFRKDIARLKGFLTSDYDKLRRPYDRRDSEYPRRTVFAASVNDTTFLVDPTGNSRFWTIAATKIDHDHRIDMQQVFAQVAAEVQAGEQWWLTQAEDDALAAQNDHHAAPSVVADAVQTVLDLEAGENAKLTATTPTQLLQAAGIKAPTNSQAKECGTILRQMFGSPRKINGINKWRVPMRDHADAWVPPEKREGYVNQPGEVF